VSGCPRDHYVRLGGNDYSVHPAAVGRRVEVHADLDTVTVTCAGTVVAVHPRIWASHQTITDPDHHAAAVPLRAAPRAATSAAASQGSAQAVGSRSRAGRAQQTPQVAARSLSDYDALFDLGDFTGDVAADVAADVTGEQSGTGKVA
jgi:hypothetical protein